MTYAEEFAVAKSIVEASFEDIDFSTILEAMPESMFDDSAESHAHRIGKLIKKFEVAFPTEHLVPFLTEGEI